MFVKNAFMYIYVEEEICSSIHNNIQVVYMWSLRKGDKFQEYYTCTRTNTSAPLCCCLMSLTNLAGLCMSIGYI